jgi:hypothetical protein
VDLRKPLEQHPLALFCGPQLLELLLVDMPLDAFAHQLAELGGWDCVKLDGRARPLL